MAPVLVFKFTVSEGLQVLLTTILLLCTYKVLRKASARIQVDRASYGNKVDRIYTFFYLNGEDIFLLVLPTSPGPVWAAARQHLSSTQATLSFHHFIY